MPLDKLALFGTTYLADFVNWSIQKEVRQREYRCYIADCLYVRTMGAIKTQWCSIEPSIIDGAPEKTPEEIRESILAELEAD